MKYRSMKIENFRKFHNINFTFGQRITVISGENGIGKSSLLSLIASTTGTNSRDQPRRLNGIAFRPEFLDLFKISEKEEYKTYRLLVDYDQKINNQYYLTKRIGFYDYTANNRGVRILPRTSVPINNHVGITQNQANDDAKNLFGITDSKRIQMPTIYLSLSRLFPLGETNLKSTPVSKNSNIFRKKYADFFVKCYNAVLPNSIDPDNFDAYFVEKETLGKKHLVLTVKDTTNDTQSVGQDNLSSIVSALTDFYAIKENDSKNYNGGVLCIDELDASFHPSAVLALWKLLVQLSSDLNLQIIVTTHSLTILKEIIKLDTPDQNDFRLVYFKDTNIPRVSKFNDYELLKSDLFNQISFRGPTIKTYCEDKRTSDTLELLLDSAKSLNLYIGNPDVSITNIDVSLGKNHLKSLVSTDDYFKSILIILDGDARLRNGIDNNNALQNKDFDKGFHTSDPHANNIVFLPSFCPPEIFLFNILKDYANHPVEHQTFWNALEFTPKLSLYTSSKIQEMFNTNSVPSFDEIHENVDWWTKIIDFFGNTHLLQNYFSNQKNKPILENFINHYNRALHAVDKKNKSHLFD